MINWLKSFPLPGDGYIIVDNNNSEPIVIRGTAENIVAIAVMGDISAAFLEALGHINTIIMPCGFCPGLEVVAAALRDRVDLPCGCGNEHHWIIRFYPDPGHEL